MLGVIFSCLLISASAGLQLKVPTSPVTCSNEGVECEINGDNLIDAVMHVPTLEECRQLCLDVKECNYETYFNETASPASNLCLLFKTCETTNNCSDCVSENMDCFEMCGRNVVGDLDENVQDIIPNTESEKDCQQLCLNTTSCSHYTYYFQNDTMFQKFCFLQTDFLPPIQSCETCITGPVSCQEEKCRLTMNGELYQSLMLTTSTNEITVNGFGCGLRFLVVGGGGDDGGDGGAGSGYLQYGSVEVDPGTTINAKVGQSKQSSVLTFSTGETITAEAGEGGVGSRGGNGYSGGGQEGPYNSGTDGGDGEGSYGGSGTGEDISAYTFSAWTLTPGAGGRGTRVSEGTSGHYYGGGGGGVVISGAGPDGSDYQGEGYGGGASGYGYYGDGLQGVILLEIV